MVKKIHIEKYRKIQNISIELSPGLNVIAGTNGTCKTSLLHIISNSFQAVTSTCEWLRDKKCISSIKAINDAVNPKVETLTRGDKKYNDPAHGLKGALFSVDYYNREPLEFRRHNSSLNSRYAIKPKYQNGSEDKLPYCPVLYLGLSRLVPFGEFRNDELIKKIDKGLPQEYLDNISIQYKRFTKYSISKPKAQQMGDVKTRTEFSSDMDGIDSNTISAGEDNLYILLTAIESLRYYYESIDSTNEIESILLIDELDATLHPEFQIKLLKLLRSYSQEYKIQVVFTSHSMTLLEDMLNKKDNVIYLLDNISNVHLLDNPDIYKIKMHLSSLTDEEIYIDKIIPVFTEDKEARFLIELLFNYFEEKNEEFRSIRRFFYLPDINLGADSLTNMFKDTKLMRTTMSAICILDGDHGSDLNNNIIALPGKNYGGNPVGKSPEKLLVEYADILYKEDDTFWVEPLLIEKGYGKRPYLDRIVQEIEEYESKKESETTEVKERVFYKKLFNDNKFLFEMLFKHWIHNKNNNNERYRFYNELKALFKKNAMYNGINPNSWNQ